MHRKEIFVTRSFIPPLEEYIEEIKDIWDSHFLSNMGPKHKLFQEQLLQYLLADHIELFTNGHMALELSLGALRLQGEVITTPFTFASTTHAIVRNGLEPVFCDINNRDYTIDVAQIESLITKKTCAIVPVHVYGNLCNIEEIQSIAEEYNLKVVYDAAHAFGETYKGKGIGLFGDVSCFSFHATKVFNSIEGGAACYRDEEVGERLQRLKNFGIEGPESVKGVGLNAKLNEFCAAMGICNLRYVNDCIAKRKVVTEYYRQRLKDIDGVILNSVCENIEYNYSYFPVVFDEKILGFNRDEVFERLKENGIRVRKYFYPLTNTFEYFYRKYDMNCTPVALGIANSILTLPLYDELSLSEVDRICDVILGMKSRAL